VPDTVAGAEHRVRAIVAAIGETFDPRRSFADYPADGDMPGLIRNYTQELDRCLDASRLLLGERLTTVVADELRRNGN